MSTFPLPYCLLPETPVHVSETRVDRLINTQHRKSLLHKLTPKNNTTFFSDYSVSQRKESLSGAVTHLVFVSIHWSVSDGAPEAGGDAGRADRAARVRVLPRQAEVEHVDRATARRPEAHREVRLKRATPPRVWGRRRRPWATSQGTRPANTWQGRRSG